MRLPHNCNDSYTLEPQLIEECKTQDNLRRGEGPMKRFKRENPRCQETMNRSGLEPKPAGIYRAARVESSQLGSCPCQCNLLRAASAIVADAERSRPISLGCGGESHRDLALTAGRHAAAAVVLLRKVRRVLPDNRNLADGNRCLPLVAQADGRWRTLRSDLLIAEVHPFRREIDHRSSARESHRLRTPRGVIFDRELSVRRPLGFGVKRYLNLAVCADLQA